MTLTNFSPEQNPAYEMESKLIDYVHDFESRVFSALAVPLEDVQKNTTKRKKLIFSL
jgi:hypothetical protein